MVNISSSHARQAKTKFAFHSITKAATDSLSRLLAVGPNRLDDRVNAIAPPNTITLMPKYGFQSLRAKMAATGPNPSCGTHWNRS